MQCNEGGKEISTFSCEYESEAGVRPCTVTSHTHVLATRRGCGSKSSTGNKRVTDLVFANDDAILADSLGVLVKVLDALETCWMK